jgi:hypothetical protein
MQAVTNKDQVIQGKILFDLECFPNFFQVGVEDYDTKELTNWIISEFQDDRESIYYFFTHYYGFLITVNGVHYDNVLINFFVKRYNHFRKMPTLELCQTLKHFSNMIIQNGDSDDVRKYRNWDPNWMDVDLFLYWSKMLRMSKKISLKSLAIQLRHDEIQELPFPHDLELTPNEQTEVIRYNNRNDLGVLRKLFDEKIEEVRLRRFIKYEYDLTCWSMDAPKIASEFLLKDYCNGLGLEPKEVRKRTFGEYYGTIGHLLQDVEFKFKHPELKKVYDLIVKSKRNFSHTFIFRDNNSQTNIKLSLGIGGIHSLIENKQIKAKQGQIYKSSDVQSLYPNLIINYNLCRFPQILRKYADVKRERVLAKKEGLKQKDTLMKLILNSFSGLIDNVYSWLYYPEGALKLRILGQLIELKALDECVAAGYKVIALNTDSIDVIIPEKESENYEKILDDLAKQYNIIFEHEEIAWTNFVNINNYISKDSKGKIKRKGLFRHGSDIPLGDSCNEEIIPKVLELYFNKGTSVKEAVEQPWKYGFTIFDYCSSKKIDKGYEVFHNGQKVQNLNRYYFSPNSPYLFKRKLGKSTMESVHKGEGVRIYNKHVEKPWDDYKIDYQHYIKAINQIIYKLEKDEIQLSLF